jgi:hypothetical protein
MVPQIVRSRCRRREPSPLCAPNPCSTANAAFADEHTYMTERNAVYAKSRSAGRTVRAALGARCEPWITGWVPVGGALRARLVNVMPLTLSPASGPRKQTTIPGGRRRAARKLCSRAAQRHRARPRQLIFTTRPEASPPPPAHAWRSQGSGCAPRFGPPRACRRAGGMSERSPSLKCGAPHRCASRSTARRTLFEARTLRVPRNVVRQISM